MDFNATFPLRFWINLGRREDRRAATESRLAEIGITAERFPAIDARCKRVAAPDVLSLSDSVPEVEVRGYESAGRYALALTQRLALREAKRRRAPAVLLLEDDVIFHPNFRQLIQSVELPADWGLCYLGCSHRRRPQWAGDRLLRTRFAVDTHAVAVRAHYYDEVMEALDRHGKPDGGVAKASDQFLAQLQRTIPSYACFPNLAWQDVSGSDLLGSRYSNYGADGSQLNFPDTVRGLLHEMAGGATDDSPNQPPDAPGFPPAVIARKAAPPVRLGLLFLTRGDVNNPQLWSEFIEEAPDRIAVFCHPKDPGALSSAVLKGTPIPECVPTKWGTISLVRASLALLRHALQDESLTHFALLSESCIPVRPLPQILRRLDLDPRSQFAWRTLDNAKPGHAARINTAPGVPAGCWRFTSQWWLLDRTAATFAAGADFTPLFETMMAPDEAYFATVMAIQGYPLDKNVLNRDVTWTSWKKKTGSPTAWPELPLEEVRKIMHSGALFARKFPPGADAGKYRLHLSDSARPGSRSGKTG